MLSDLFQPLEARRLLSATVSYDAGNRTLNVTGDKADDNIRLEVMPVQVGGEQGTKQNAIRVFVDGQLAFNSLEFSRGPIEVVHLDGAGGNDAMQASLVRPGKLMVLMDGGQGDDAIAASSEGGRGIIITGGDGNDHIKATDLLDARSVISGNDGNDTIYSSVRASQSGNVVEGGAGDDFIWLDADESGKLGFDTDGGMGNDVILGSVRADRIDAAGGDDEVHAGAGDDKVQGGDGADVISADEGDDMVDAGGDSASDFIDGGAGMDTAVIGGGDKAVDVEVLS